MANIFPKSANILPIKIGIALACLGLLVVAAVWYYFTPKYTRVGYQPQQPISYSHALHVKQLGMDCRYCHSFVDQAAHANIPNSQTCNNCHKQGGVQWDNPKLSVLRESVEKNVPIQWKQVHLVPDYVYFNHSAHVNRGVSCISCHGKVKDMEVVSQEKPLSMGFCLECHRAPAANLRPLNKVYDLDWTAESEGKNQAEVGKQLVGEWNVRPPTNCAGCHR